MSDPKKDVPGDPKPHRQQQQQQQIQNAESNTELYHRLSQMDKNDLFELTLTQVSKTLRNVIFLFKVRLGLNSGPNLQRTT